MKTPLWKRAHASLLNQEIDDGRLMFLCAGQALIAGDLSAFGDFFQAIPNKNRLDLYSDLLLFLAANDQLSLWKNVLHVTWSRSPNKFYDFMHSLIRDTPLLEDDEKKLLIDESISYTQEMEAKKAWSNDTLGQRRAKILGAQYGYDELLIKDFLGDPDVLISVLLEMEEANPHIIATTQNLRLEEILNRDGDFGETGSLKYFLSRGTLLWPNFEKMLSLPWADRVLDDSTMRLMKNISLKAPMTKFPNIASFLLHYDLSKNLSSPLSSSAPRI